MNNNRSTSAVADSPRIDRPLDAPEEMAVPQKPAPATPAKAAKKPHGPLFWIIVTVLGLAALVWVVDFALHAYRYESTDDAYIAGHVHEISPRAAGAVIEVLVDENQTVTAGQVLVKIDPLEYEIALKRAQANLGEDQAGVTQAQAAVEQAHARVGEMQAQVSQAQAEVLRAAAQSTTAIADYGRDSRLYSGDSRAIAKSDVDTTKGAFDASQAAVNASKASLEAARSDVTAAQAAVDAAEGQLAAAQAKEAAGQAAVSDAERELSYTTITAPVAGRIGNKSVEVGNRVQVGQAIFALVQPDLWVSANFKETQLAHVAPHQKVAITIDAIPEHEFTGEVESIAPATGAQFALLPPDNATGNFTKVVQRVPAKIVFDPESVKGYEDRIRPGLSSVVDVRIR
jgi:membrane fusion protein (multidrug efflux system)